MQIGSHTKCATCVDDHHLGFRLVWFGGVDVDSSVVHTFYEIAMSFRLLAASYGLRTSGFQFLKMLCAFVVVA